MNASDQLSEILLAEHRPVLFRYALLQLRDNEPARRRRAGNLQPLGKRLQVSKARLIYALG